MVAAARVAKQSANRPNAVRVHELMTSMTPIQPRPSLTGEPPNILQRRRASEKQDSRDSTLAKTSPASVDASARPTSSRSSTSSGCSVCHKNNSFDELLLCDNECGRGMFVMDVLASYATEVSNDIVLLDPDRVPHILPDASAGEDP